jgi:hypothetical protein
MDVAQIVLLALTIAVAIVTLARYFGGRARSELEVVNVANARLQATLVEKDVALEEKEKTIAGMSERLARLDEERKEWGGTKVYETLLAQQQEMASLFRQLSEQAAAHETRAADRARQMLGLIETVGNELARCFKNGGDK